jgi:cephalosporin-C deacetylase-like acetyl esterase
MPSLPNDNGSEFSLLQKSWYDVVVPEYYGYARSGWLFTPSGCIQAVLDTVKIFSKGSVQDVWGNKALQVSYEKIIIVGSSFGGWIAAMAPKFEPCIKEIILLYPQLAPAKYGTLWLPEETTHEFRRTCKQGYNGLFRRWDDAEWQAMFADQGPYVPMEHYEHLKDVSVFMGHGTADDVIHYSRTKEFYKKLTSYNPTGTYEYVEYYGLGHGGICKQAIMEWRLWHKANRAKL